MKKYERMFQYLDNTGIKISDEELVKNSFDKNWILSLKNDLETTNDRCYYDDVQALIYWDQRMYDLEIEKAKVKE